MNLQFLIPSLRTTCVAVLTHHALGTLSPNAAVAAAFDQSNGAHILFIEDDTSEVRCPSYIVYCVVIFGSGGLTTFVEVIKGLNLSREHEVERMTSSMLSLLAARLYEFQLADERLLALAGILNRYAVQGVVAGIARATMEAKPPESARDTHPERN
jgi:hypothetical protein